MIEWENALKQVPVFLNVIEHLEERDTVHLLRVCKSISKHRHFIKARSDIFIFNASDRYGSIDLAASRGDIEVIDYLIAKFQLAPHQCRSATLNAAVFGQLPTLQWLYERGFTIYSGTMDSVIEEGHIAVLDWLWEEKFIPESDNALGRAVAKGRLNVLDWFHKHGYEGDEFIGFFAVEQCKVETFEWLHAHKWYIMPEVVNGVARKKNMVLLEWLHNHNYRGTWSAVKHAIEEENIPLVQILMDNHYCTVRDAFQMALASHSVVALEYMHQFVDPDCEMTLTELIEGYGNIQFLVWMTAELPDCAAMEWLIGRGYTIAPEIVDSIIHEKRSLLCGWLYERGYCETKETHKRKRT